MSIFNGNFRKMTDRIDYKYMYFIPMTIWTKLNHL